MQFGVLIPLCFSCICYVFNQNNNILYIIFNHLSGRYNALVCSGCYNKSNIGGLNKRVFLTVLKAEKSKIKALAGSLPVEILLPGSQTTISSLCPHMLEGARESSGPSFIGVLFLS